MVHNEMSFLFLPRDHNSGNTTQSHIMPMVNSMSNNTKDIYGYFPKNKIRIFKSQNGTNIKDYMKEVVYNSNKTNTDPYISLLNTFNESKPSMRLKPADFVYLTDLGVYPINRLIILRRFRDGTIVPNNLTLFNEKPISTVIGWLKMDDTNKDLFSLNFNERWVETTDTLDKVIQKIMKEQFGIKTEMFMPIPAWSQGFLFGMLSNMGLTSDFNSVNVPTGDPNVLRKGIMRDVENQSLISELKITFETSYEQKYISDVDPSLAFQDIISNLLRMGTSDHKFVINQNSPTFQSFVSAVNSNAKGSTDQWINFGKDIINSFMSAVSNFFSGAAGEYKALFKASEASDKTAQLKQDSIDKTEQYYNSLAAKNPDKKLTALQERQKQNELNKLDPKKKAEGSVGKVTGVSAAKDTATEAVRLFKLFGDTLLAGSVYRYRWPLKGSIGMMSGLNTTPWHLTVGNPFSPILNIGNILVNNVDLKFSNEMGFNDMPKRVNVTIDIKFGRDLGRQEIEKMFNNQYSRIYSNPADKKQTEQKEEEKGVDKQTPTSASEPQQTMNEQFENAVTKPIEKQTATERSMTNFKEGQKADNTYRQNTVRPVDLTGAKPTGSDEFVKKWFKK